MRCSERRRADAVAIGAPRGRLVPAATRGNTEKRIAETHLKVSSSLALVPSPSF